MDDAHDFHAVTPGLIENQPVFKIFDGPAAKAARCRFAESRRERPFLALLPGLQDSRATPKGNARPYQVRPPFPDSQDAGRFPATQEDVLCTGPSAPITPTVLCTRAQTTSHILDHLRREVNWLAGI